MTKTSPKTSEKDEKSSKGKKEPESKKRSKSSPKKSPDRSKNTTTRKRPRLTVLKSVNNRLANARKARAARVLRNAKASRTGATTSTANRETKVYVGNLPESTRKIEIEKEFIHIGRIRDIWVAENPPGFAFVTYFLGRDAAKAVREMDGKNALGCRLRVEIARPLVPKERPRGAARGRTARSRSPNRDRRMSGPRSGDRRTSGGRLPGRLSRRDRRDRPRPSRDQPRSRPARDQARNAPLGNRLRGRLGRTLSDGRRSPLRSPGGSIKKGKKKKGGKGKKKRFGRGRALNTPLQNSEPLRKPSLSPPRYSNTPELRLGSPPRRGAGIDLPPPPPLLPLPPADLYDVFDSRYRNMEINRFRGDDLPYNGGGQSWGRRSPSPLPLVRGLMQSYFNRSPSPPLRGGIPRTPPLPPSLFPSGRSPKRQQLRRSLSPLPLMRGLDPRKRPLTPPKNYRDPYIINEFRAQKARMLNRSPSPRGWPGQYGSPPLRRPPSPTLLLPHSTGFPGSTGLPRRWNSPPRHPLPPRWSRSPPPAIRLDSLPLRRRYSRGDSPPPRRPPSPPPLPKAYGYGREHGLSPLPLQRQTSNIRQHSPPPRNALPPRQISPSNWKGHRSRSPRPRTPPRQEMCRSPRPRTPPPRQRSPLQRLRRTRSPLDQRSAAMSPQARQRVSRSPPLQTRIPPRGSRSSPLRHSRSPLARVTRSPLGVRVRSPPPRQLSRSPVGRRGVGRSSPSRRTRSPPIRSARSPLQQRRTRSPRPKTPPARLRSPQSLRRRHSYSRSPLRVRSPTPKRRNSSYREKSPESTSRSPPPKRPRTPPYKSGSPVRRSKQSLYRGKMPSNNGDHRTAAYRSCTPERHQMRRTSRSASPRSRSPVQRGRSLIRPRSPSGPRSPPSPSPPRRGRSSMGRGSQSPYRRPRSPSPRARKSPLPKSYRLRSPSKSPPRRMRTPPRGYTPPPLPPSQPSQRWTPPPPMPQLSPLPVRGSRYSPASPPRRKSMGRQSGSSTGTRMREGSPPRDRYASSHRSPPRKTKKLEYRSGRR